MARRSDHSREELKELAIQAGLRIIKNEGFSNFSARKVAADIGYTIGTLYHVFGTYDDFILHLNARTLDIWYDVMQEDLRAHKKGDPIRAMAKSYIRFSREYYNEWIALFEHHMHNGKPVPEWYEPKMIRFFALVEDLLLPMTNNSRKKAHRAARILWAGIHGISILSLSDKLDLVGAESAEMLANSFVDHYLAGVKNDD
jgi:AcrR family transcriptional regulator